MPEDSPILGLPYSTENDFAADYPTVDSARTLELERYTIPRFADADSRAAKIPGPAVGMVTVLTTAPAGGAAPLMEVWDGSQWRRLADTQTGAFAVATGGWSAGVAGSNTVPLSAIAAQRGGPWTISSGALVTPFDGVYLSIYYAKVASGSYNQVWVGGSSVLSDDIHIPSAAMSARSGNYATVGWRAAGAVFPKNVVYTAPTAGSSGNTRLHAIYLGNPPP